MLKTILHIRFRQFGRMMQEIGVIYLLLLLLVLFPLTMGILLKLSEIPPMWVTGMMLVGLLSIHLNRADKNFLKLVLKRPFPLYLMEYAILTFPAAIWLIYLKSWLALLILLAGIFLVSLPQFTLRLKPNKQIPVLKFPNSFIRHFEWVSGLRKHAFTLIILYLLGLGLCMFTATSPVILFLIGITTTDFHFDCEPSTFVELYGKTPRSFLHQKIGWHLLIFWLTCSPLVILFLIFHGQYWYILAVAMLIISIFPILSITLKYASYQPNIRLSQNGITLGFMIGFLVFPFTQPVPLVMAVIYYKKALKNMRQWL